MRVGHAARCYPQRLKLGLPQIALLVTWLCLLVGDSLFNVATLTGAIDQARQVRIKQHPGRALLPKASYACRRQLVFGLASAFFSVRKLAGPVVCAGCPN